jgi:hypothetical protein
MILGVAGAETAYTLGFQPVGDGERWQLRPAGQGAVVSPTFAASQTIDWSTGTIFVLTLTANVTFIYANVTVGQTILLELTQDGTGSRTGTFPTGSIFVGGSKTLTTTASATDTVSVTCTAVGTYLCQLLKAYA